MSAFLSMSKEPQKNFALGYYWAQIREKIQDASTLEDLVRYRRRQIKTTGTLQHKTLNGFLIPHRYDQFKAAFGLNPTTLCKRNHAFKRDNKVVKYLNVNKCQCIRQSARNAAVSLTRLCDARRVIVVQDNGSGIFS